MAFKRQQARELSTKAEFGLVRDSYRDAIGKLTPGELQSRITRARRLRNKHRDLLRRQKLASRARSGSKVGAAARTAQKAELFDETLERFTERLQSMKPRKKRKSGQTALRQKARTPRMKAIQAHASSRGRRRQARRDSR